jgi:hypothetical protein
MLHYGGAALLGLGPENQSAGRLNATPLPWLPPQQPAGSRPMSPGRGAAARTAKPTSSHLDTHVAKEGASHSVCCWLGGWFFP